MRKAAPFVARPASGQQAAEQRSCSSSVSIGPGWHGAGPQRGRTVRLVNMGDVDENYWRQEGQKEDPEHLHCKSGACCSVGRSCVTCASCRRSPLQAQQGMSHLPLVVAALAVHPGRCLARTHMRKSTHRGRSLTTRRRRHHCTFQQRGSRAHIHAASMLVLYVAVIWRWIFVVPSSPPLLVPHRAAAVRPHLPTGSQGHWRTALQPAANPDPHATARKTGR